MFKSLEKTWQAFKKCSNERLGWIDSLTLYYVFLRLLELIIALKIENYYYVLSFTQSIGRLTELAASLGVIFGGIIPLCLSFCFFIHRKLFFYIGLLSLLFAWIANTFFVFSSLEVFIEYLTFHLNLCHVWVDTDEIILTYLTLLTRIAHFLFTSLFMLYLWSTRKHFYSSKQFFK